MRNMDRQQKYIKRLADEWIEYGKIIIAVDYDDTISPWRLSNERDCKEVIDILIQARREGAFIVVNTACNPDRFEEIKSYCSSYGLEIDSINSNPINLPYGMHGKVYANIYIDDRADLWGGLDILKAAMYWKRGFDASQDLDEIA